jgi:hypothetical protein
VPVACNNATWHAGHRHRFGLPDLDRATSQTGRSAGKRIEGPDLPGQLDGRQSPVNCSFRLFDLGGIAHSFLRLRAWQQRQALQRFDDQAGTECGELVVQCRCRIVLSDGQAFCKQQRAGIQPCLHLHDADAGLGIAGENRPLDRCRTAPARQQ